MTRDNVKVFLIVIMLFVVSFSLIFSTENPPFADEVSPAESISAPNWNYSIEELSSVAMSDDGQYFVAGSYTLGIVYLFETESNALLWSSNLTFHLGGDVSISSVDISANGDYLVAGTQNEGIFLFSKESPNPLWNFSSGAQGTEQAYVNHNVVISSSGDYITVGLYSESPTRGLFLFGKESNVPLWHNDMGGAMVSSLAISDDGEVIMANSYLFSKDSNTSFRFDSQGGPSWAKGPPLSINSDGSKVALRCDGSYDSSSICIHSTLTKEQIWSYTPPGNFSEYGYVDTFSLSPNGDYIIVGWYKPPPANGLATESFMLFKTDEPSPINIHVNNESLCTCYTVEVSNTGASMVSDYNTISFYDHTFETPLAQYNWTDFSDEFNNWYDADISFESMNVVIQAKNTIYSFSIGDNSRGDDAWLNLELISWQGNSSTTWDTDGTDMDVQFQVCIDLDGDSDGISPLCTWTEVWNNTLTLSNAWETAFDLIEDNTTLNITIECWDNDDENDEWGNGPDACDMNPNDDEWRLYYEANWSNITTDTFGGDGSIGNDTQWGNAESTWKVTVSYYGDEDNDGTSDILDVCENTTDITWRFDIRNGCAWYQLDSDSDGILNGNDNCPSLAEETYCSAEGQYLPIGKMHISNRLTKELANHQWDISPDGNTIAVSVGRVYGQTGNSSIYGLVLLDATKEFQFADDDCCYNPNNNAFLQQLPAGCLGYGEAGGCDKARDRVYFSANGSELSIYTPTTIAGDLEVSKWFNTSDWSLSPKTSNAAYSPQRGSLQYSVGYHQDGFRIYDNINKIEQIVSNPQEFVRAANFVDDSNSFLIATVDEQPIYNQLVDPTQNETLEIYNVSSGQKFGISLPEMSRFVDAKLSANGLRVVVSHDYVMQIYERDRDSDGLIDTLDLCPNIQGTAEFTGCPEQFSDTDNDGLIDSIDQCPSTQIGMVVDINGCALNQIDSDSDGISNANDLCPNTPLNESVGLSGCSPRQLDADGDGIYDHLDDCPNTPSDATVDSKGCAPNDVVDLDSDGDGVRDSIDECPDSSQGIVVDLTGCQTNGDVQSSDDSVESSLIEDLFYGSICILLVIGVMWGGRNREQKSSYQFSTVQPEDNLELQNRISNLEREKRRTEHEMSQIKRQHSSQSSASEIQSMERQIKELQQRVSNSELSKSQLKQEMRVQQQRVSQSSAAEIAEMQEEMRALQQRVSESERAKGQLKMEIEQVKSDNIASLEMQDSVIAGDVVSSGATKIDQQTNETHSTIGIQDSAFTGDAITSGAQKIESQTNVTGFDVDAMTKLLDRERANAIETAKMAEELARLRKESGE